MAAGFGRRTRGAHRFRCADPTHAVDRRVGTRTHASTRIDAFVQLQRRIVTHPVEIDAALDHGLSQRLTG